MFFQHGTAPIEQCCRELIFYTPYRITSGSKHNQRINKLSHCPTRICKRMLCNLDIPCKMLLLIPVDVASFLHTRKGEVFSDSSDTQTDFLSAITVYVQKVHPPKTKAYYKGEKLVALRRCQRGNDCTWHRMEGLGRNSSPSELSMLWAQPQPEVWFAVQPLSFAQNNVHHQQKIYKTGSWFFLSTPQPFVVQ